MNSFGTTKQLFEELKPAMSEMNQTEFVQRLKDPQDGLQQPEYLTQSPH